MSQELVKFAMADKVKEQFNYDELYQDVYDLCLKLMQSLKLNCNINDKAGFGNEDFTSVLTGTEQNNDDFTTNN